MQSGAAAARGGRSRDALAWRIARGGLLRLTALVFVLLMQGPALLVQEIGWATMLVDYSRERGLKQGVVETFDGRHPCRLCTQAAKLRGDPGEDSRPKRQPSPVSLRFAWSEMTCAEPLAVPARPVADLPAISSVSDDPRPGRGRDAPPAPPPEGA